MGPAPKPAAARSRRNRASTRATLRVLHGEEAAARIVPPLPRAAKGEAWHAQVQAWWRDLWQRSDLTDQFLEHERDALRDIALLLNMFWRNRDLNARREARLLSSAFGLDPMARRRLQQEVDAGEAAEERTRRRRNERVAASGAVDPRDALGETADG